MTKRRAKKQELSHFGLGLHNVKDGSLDFADNLFQLRDHGAPLEGGIWAKTNSNCRLNFRLSLKVSQGSALGAIGIDMDSEKCVILSCVLQYAGSKEWCLRHNEPDLIAAKTSRPADWQNQLVLVGNVETMKSAQEWIPAEIEIKFGYSVCDVFSGQMYLSAADGLTHILCFPGEREMAGLGVVREVSDQMKSEQIEGAPHIMQGISYDNRKLRWDGYVGFDSNGLSCGICILPDNQMHGFLEEIGVNLPMEVIDVMLGPLDL